MFLEILGNGPEIEYISFNVIDSISICDQYETITIWFNKTANNLAGKLVYEASVDFDTKEDWLNFRNNIVKQLKSK